MHVSAADQESFSRMLSSMDRIRQATELELRKLCEQPDIKAAAEQLTDALLGNLNYLFNFSHLIDGNGKRCEIMELMDRLEKDIHATFKKLTGADYWPGTIRQRVRESSSERRDDKPV